MVHGAVERVFKALDLPRRSDIEALNENLERVAAALEKLDGEREAPAPAAARRSAAARGARTTSPLGDLDGTAAQPHRPRARRAGARTTRGTGAGARDRSRARSSRRGTARRCRRRASPRRRAARRTRCPVRSAARGARGSRALDAPRVKQLGERAQQRPSPHRLRARRPAARATRACARGPRRRASRTRARSRRRTVSPRAGCEESASTSSASSRSHRAALERLGEPVAAREVVQDRGVRDADVARDVLEPDRLGPALAQPLLRGVEDQPLRLLGAAAHARVAFRFAAHSRATSGTRSDY